MYISDARKQSYFDFCLCSYRTIFQVFERKKFISPIKRLFYTEHIWTFLKITYERKQDYILTFLQNHNYYNIYKALPRTVKKR